MNIRSIIALIYVSILFGCHNGKDNPSKTRYISRETMTYASLSNQYSDINTIHPSQIKDPILYEALYETLSKPKQNNHIVESTTYDSTTRAFLFELRNDAKFSNGDYINSTHILQQFKFLIDSTEGNIFVNRFESNLKGYKRYLALSKHKFYQDSLPNGIKRLSDKRFSISLVEHDPDFLNLIAQPVFTIYKKTNEQYFGSGGFALSTDNKQTVLARQIALRDSNLTISPVNKIKVLNNNSLKDVMGLFMNKKVDMAYLSMDETNTFSFSKSSYNKLIRKIPGQLEEMQILFIASREENDLVKTATLNQYFNIGDSIPYYYQRRNETWIKPSFDSLTVLDTAQEMLTTPYINIGVIDSGDSSLLYSVNAKMSTEPSNQTFKKRSTHLIGTKKILSKSQFETEAKIQVKMDSLFLRFPVKSISAYVIDKGAVDSFMSFNYICIGNDDNVSISELGIKKIKELN